MDISHSLTLPPLNTGSDIKHTSTSKTVSFINDGPFLNKENKYSYSNSSCTTNTTDDENGSVNLISRKKSNLGSLWKGSIGRNKTLKKLLDTKTVGFAGGVTLLINGVLGPGLIPTPQLYSESGFLIPTLVFIFFTIISTLCATFIIEAMQSIPGNKHFQGTVEFSTLINFYFGKKLHFIGQVILFAAIQSTNISSIIYSAQMLDNFIINIFKKSCGVALNSFNSYNETLTESRNGVNLYCVDTLATENSPFGNQYMLITLGYIIAFICIFPIGFMKLQDNINLQIVSFSITIIIFIIWIILFFVNGVNMDFVSLIGENQSQVVGIVMFNFAFITTIPSWINIKKKEVSVQKSLWTSTITSVFLYIVIGYTAALSFKPEGTLNLLSQVGSLNIIGRITSYIFSVAILMVSIPVFSIIVRNNLVQNKICGYKTATFFSHVFPWICVLPFQTGTLINSVINWTSLLFVSSANFIIPLIIYLKCQNFNKQYANNKYLTLRQRQILKCVHWSSNTIQGFIDEYPSTKKITSSNAILKPKKVLTEETVTNVVNNSETFSEIAINNNINNKKESSLVFDNINDNKNSNELLQLPSNLSSEQTIHETSSNPTTSYNNNSNNNNEPPSKAYKLATIDDERRGNNYYTLPTHPLFISNVFEGIPSWVPFKSVTIAITSLVLVAIITLCVIFVNVYQLF